MVGVSRRDIAAVARWFGGLGMRLRAAILIGLAVAVVGLAWLVLNARQEARLVHVDPDSLPSQPALMHYAVDRGRGLFRKNCSSCHGPDGQGRHDLGAANLTDKDYLYGEGSVSDIETVVLYGIRAPNGRTWKLADMPAFGTPKPYAREAAIKPLSPDDIRDMIQFLHSVQGKPADATAATRGAGVFAGRGGCYDCHAGDGRGDPAIGGPNLADDIWLYGDGSDKWIYDSIANGRAGMCPAWADRLSTVKIREVSLYVYSLSHGGAQSSLAKPSLP
jgi:cytochrome c oxidase cbb3-type subunit 3